MNNFKNNPKKKAIQYHVITKLKKNIRLTKGIPMRKK